MLTIGSMAPATSSAMVPPPSERDASSSFGVVSRSNHHLTRGAASSSVESPSCGGKEKPFRVSLKRAPAIGVSTVRNRVSKPAAAARSTSPYETSRSRIM